MRYIGPDTFRSEPGALEEAEFVRRTIRSLNRYFERRIQERAEQLGFTLPQVRLLRQVTSQPGITVTRLAHVLEVSQSTASDIVARLAAKGILERRPDPADKRSAGLWPTAPVDAFMGSDRTEFVNSHVAELLASLGIEGRDVVMKAMRLLAASLEQAEGVERARG